jgi:hypothetical protein
MREQVKGSDIDNLLFWEKLIKKELNKHSSNGNMDTPSSLIMRKAFSDIREEIKLCRKKNS